MDNWSRVEELFQAALAQPRENRAAYLRDACPDDEQSRREVLELLDHADSKDGFLEGSPLASLAAPPARLAPGKMVGRFQIVDLIGAGGMGEVYKARDTRLNRTVAVKVCRERFGERFEREARAIAALNHPNICTLYDVGPDYLVMEYLEGQPLRGPLPLPLALHYGAQAADALHAAHSKGVVHRDFKPANVLVTKTGVKLLDFGLAKLAATGDNLSKENNIPGTLRYMAPEQVEGKPADSRSDIYAFGLVLYEMISGSPAFGASSPASLISAILKEEPPALSSVQPSIPAALDRVVSKCLAKDPDARWQTAADLHDELLWIAQPGTPRVSPVTARSAHRQFLRWLPAGAAAAIVLAGGLFWQRFGSSPAPSWAATRLGGASTGMCPRISPDKQLVAFLTLVGDLLQVAVMKSDGSSWTVLTNQTESGWANELAWSPDGSKIYYSRHYTRPQGVYSVPTLGGEPSLILANAAGGLPLPDGSLIVAKIGTEGHLQLHRFWPESGRIDALPAFLAPVGNFPVTVLPGGREIAFQGYSETVSGPTGLHVLDLATGKARVAGAALKTGGPVAAMPDGTGMVTTARAEDLVQVVKVSRDDSRPAEVLFSLPGDNIVRSLDAGQDGSIFVGTARNAALLLRFAVDGGDPRQFVMQDLGVADFGSLSGDRFIRPSIVAGKSRLLVSTGTGETRPLVQTAEETGVPFALSGGGGLACMIGTGPKRQIAIASVRDGRILKRVPMPAANIRSMALSPDDGTLYYASGGAVWSLALTGSAQPRRVIDGNQLSLDPRGRYLYVKQMAKSPALLVRVPVAGGATETVPIPKEWRLTVDNPPANAVDARGRMLFEVASADSLFFSAALFDPARRTVTRIPLRFHGEIWAPAWTPEGQIAALGGPFFGAMWHYHPARR
ncbi:MAG: protein kinase [Acidobacteria bacterium]|nr:protein kinase [Acidobacteriota bacterium]